MLNMTRDRRWLMIEVCREFQRSKCSREADECRYAHPPAHVAIENGHVTACFDSLKDQCTRDTCKYLHPPKLVKEELQASSRAFSQTQTAIQQLCNPVMLQQQAALCATASQNMMSPWGFMVPQVMPLSFAPTAVMLPEVPCSGGRRKDKSDKLEVCREYQRSQCPRGNDECKYAHPEPHIHPDPADNMVTVCMDFMKERCERESCRYFHPPPHLQARVKANQLNASSLMAAAAQSQVLALGPTQTPAGMMSTTAASTPPFLNPAVLSAHSAISHLPSIYGLGGLNTFTNAGLATSGLANTALSLSNPGLANVGLAGVGLAGAGLAGAGLAGAGIMTGNTGLYGGDASYAAAYALPKDPLARSTLLAQMAAEKAVLNSRKRKLIDSMSTYPDLVKRQALGASLAAGPGIMSPWSISQQMALQGVLAAAQPIQLANSTILNPAAALMHQQAALGYTTYAIPVSAGTYALPTQYTTTQTETAPVTPTQ